MGKEITYRCDKCGCWINKADAARNGETEDIKFEIYVKNKEEEIFFYESVFMCPSCWKKFEKMYFDFMRGKASK